MDPKRLQRTQVADEREKVRPRLWHPGHCSIHCDGQSLGTNSLTDCYKICHRWLGPRDDPLSQILCKSAHRELLNKWVKYNKDYNTLFLDPPRDQIQWQIFMCESSKRCHIVRGCAYLAQKTWNQKQPLEIPKRKTLVQNQTVFALFAWTRICSTLPSHQIPHRQELKCSTHLS